MANRYLILVLFLVVFVTGKASGITEISNPAADIDSIVNPIDKIALSGGDKIEIVISPELMELILQPPKGKAKSHQGDRGQKYTPQGISYQEGYRVQVFYDGRNQSNASRQAKLRGQKIAARMPKFAGQVYTTSNPPNWTTRVGNFLNMSDAQKALGELKRAFPEYAGEMRVVRCRIKVIR